ncbi:chromosome segregation protein SMC [Dellaglioa carnosa]|uniref:chromosome segregation protein SMC n=1 Tax=Dellaglioa carnosa TaxID=2995136 RepID=UPI0022A8475E|nr:chromosome segregation protein SMC [Dellaglioa carnosa]MCZ2492666.1 chromosome segregation protein SMC [Dellaglioa carnosa]
MKLESLVIDGFKSFADKTTIEFKDGMTGVVGPNGSGKSNIIEAIRWVLGEQSAKNLRGSKMPDVIFAGSTNRVSINRAEVSITFDNSDFYIQDNPEKITVTRRLFRDGNSEFMINQRQCRLKDITNLFMDTGLGKESFSIISQGRVAEIFNSKPEDRRSIIEEVAGVLKYKQEKHVAVRQLEETKGHLDRVSDIIFELKGQLDPLREQSSLAKDYVAQKKQFDELELSRLVKSIKRQSLQKESVVSSLDKLIKMDGDFKTKVTIKEQEVTKHRTELEKIENLIDQTQNDLLDLTINKERLTGQSNVSSQKKDFEKQKITELKNEQETLADQIKLKQEALVSMNKRLLVLQQNITDEEVVISSIDNELSNISVSSEDHLKNLENNANEAIQQRTRLQSENEFLQKLIKANKITDEQPLINEQDQLNQLQNDFSIKKTKFDLVASKLANEEQRIAELKTNLKVDVKSYENQQRNWFEASNVLQQAKNKKDNLRSIQNSYNGYYQGVKEILKEKAQFLGLYGSVAELMTVPKEINTAIETALGAQLQQVVVQDETVGKSAIKFLTQKNYGRATFLPISVIKGRVLSNTQRSVLSHAGVIGVAAELVQVDPRFSEVNNYLLGSTIIVQDMDAAITVSRLLSHRIKVVTLTGEVMNAGGSMTGGKQQRTGGLLNQKQTIVQLDDSIKKMQQELDTRETQGNQTRMAIENQKQVIESIELSIVDLKNQYQETQSQLTTGRLTLEQQELMMNEKSITLKEKQTNQINNEKKYKINTEKITELMHLIEAVNVEITEINVQLKNTGQFEKQQRVRKQNHRESLLVFQEQLKQQNGHITQLNAEIKHLTQEQVSAKERHQELIKRTESSRMQAGEIQEKIQEFQKKMDNSGQKINDFKQKRSEINQVLTEENEYLSRISELQRNVIADKIKTENQRQQLDDSLDTSLNKLSSEFQKTFEEATKSESKQTFEAILLQQKLLKKGLKEIGDVNVASIDEFERVNERYSFLLAQQADLLEADEQLKKTMFDMDTEVEKRFKHSFDEISKAFEAIFPVMFGGGKARLQLTDPDNLLTTGIDILAQPPGKKVQSLSLLSGGEQALTAITLLFAILRVKPVPFCILDEAEAALDDANVARFASYLKSFHQETQFIVITHRNGTMVEANTLYGVTMQESGISKMVSVSLDNVV